MSTSPLLPPPPPPPPPDAAQSEATPIIWTDITSMVKDAAKQLNAKEPMITSEDYSCFEAMNAIELMDPKMDQCYGIQGSMKIEDLLSPTLSTQLNDEVLAKLLKTLVVQETAFLDGASLLESTHQCIFAWEGSWSGLLKKNGQHERAVVAFCKALTKSMGHVSKAVMAADIYEGEETMRRKK